MASSFWEIDIFFVITPPQIDRGCPSLSNKVQFRHLSIPTHKAERKGARKFHLRLPSLSQSRPKTWVETLSFLYDIVFPSRTTDWLTWFARQWFVTISNAKLNFPTTAGLDSNLATTLAAALFFMHHHWTRGEEGVSQSAAAAAATRLFIGGAYIYPAWEEVIQKNDLVQETLKWKEGGLEVELRNNMRK